MSVLVDEHDHPYANGAGRTEQWRAVDPARTAFFVRVVEVGDGAREPSDLGGHAARAICKGVADGGAHAVAAADAVEELGLEDAGYTKGGGGEEDAEGWGRADEEVLL